MNNHVKRLRIEPMLRDAARERGRVPKEITEEELDALPNRLTRDDVIRFVVKKLQESA